MGTGIKLSVLGNVQGCRTEVEISDDADLVAIVYDTSAGWTTEVLDTGATARMGAEFDQAVDSAREKLSHYVNRRDENAPDGLTRAGLSFWLMAKDDGTTLGMPTP